MARHACKFSVIKYIPNSIKQEVVNIGVILHSSHDGTIVVKFLDHEPRIKNFLTEYQFAEFRAFKRIFNKYVRDSNQNKLIDSVLNVSLTEDDYLDRLQRNLNPPFILSKAEYIFSECVSDTIEHLYSALVLTPDEYKTKKKTLIRQIEERFSSEGIEKFIQRGIPVKSLPFDLHIEFGVKWEEYDKVDLIQPISLQDSPRENYKEGVFWRDTIERINHDPELKHSHFYAVVNPNNRAKKIGFNELIDQLKTLDNISIINYNNNEFERLIYNIKMHGKAFV